MKINVVYSTSHLLVPKIVGCILVILLLAVVVTEVWKKKRCGIVSEKESFFEEDYNKVKLFGSLILFAIYIAIMKIIGFLPASMICMFLFNAIFEGSKEKKSLILSAIYSIVFSTFIWFIFGIVFNITLP